METFEDLLRANAPVILLVEKDLAWAPFYIMETVRSLGVADRVLEYKATEGWSGPDSLMHTSGLPTVISLKTRLDPVEYLAQFSAWLRGLARNTGFVPERSPLFQGVAILHDLYREVDSPTFVRQIVDLGQALMAHSASAVLVMPAPLEDEHPLSAVVVQVRPDIREFDRHIALVRDFAEQMQPIVGEIDVAALARLLDDETLARADAILRLAALHFLEIEGQGHKGRPDLLVLVRDLKDALRSSSLDS